MITFLVPFIATQFVFGLELLVGLIQSVIFAGLTLVFLSVAVSHEEHWIARRVFHQGTVARGLAAGGQAKSRDHFGSEDYQQWHLTFRCSPLCWRWVPRR